MKIKILLTFALFVTSGIVNAQIYLMNSTTNNTNVTTCTGNLYDEGGSSGSYTANKIFVLTLTPATAGTAVQLTFTQWAVASGTTMEIFDGPSTASPQFGIFDNVNTPIGMQIMASASNPTGQLTLRWTSTASVSTGFAAGITCHIPCQQVYAHIDSLLCVPNMVYSYIDVCPHVPITFSAHGEFPQNNLVYAQSDATSLFIWDFGDGVIDTGQVVTHTYIIETGYDFSVRIEDVQGCNSTNYATARVRISSNPIEVINPVPNFCSSTSVSFITGTGPSSTIVIDNFHLGQSGELELADTTFLPDGSGVSYISDLTYTVFPAGMTLSNINDLLGVCMNMEHTYMGDLQLELICPNGSSVILLDYPNGGGGTIIGEPVGQDLPVDANSSNTTPGIGYDYCFTPTSTNGFINNSANWTYLSTYTDPIGQVSYGIDQANAGIYQADGSWNSLIGCPLNGTWQIKVTDNLSLDNGYIFSWGLNLNPALIPGGWSYTVPIDSIAWSGPFIEQQLDSSIIVSPDSGGIFTYTITIYDAFGCSYDTTFHITVINSPEVNLGNDTSLCNGTTLTLDAGNPNADAYLWSTGATSQQIQVNTTGTYIAEVTNTDGGTLQCKDSDTITVKVFPVPLVNLGTDTCTETGIVLDAGPGGAGYIYNWSNGASTQTINVSSTGIYFVEVQSGIGSPCFDKDTINIKVIPHPVVDLGPDTTICIQRSVILTATQSNETSEFTYVWNHGGSNTSSVEFSPNGIPGPHIVSVVKTGCTTATDTVIVTGKLCDVTVPNVFTPNGDGYNDFFFIKGLKDYPNTLLQIYNRWGKKIYESTNYQNDWDGKSYSDGVYFFIITFIDYYEPMTGTITIFRKN
ncbi:MAG: gliding motility-associated C-terminal domain-containing protein [Bacteroidales bacterium]